MHMHELVADFVGKRPETPLSCIPTGFCMDATLAATNATGDEKCPKCRSALQQAPSLQQRHGTMVAELKVFRLTHICRHPDL